VHAPEPVLVVPDLDVQHWEVPALLRICSRLPNSALKALSMSDLSLWNRVKALHEIARIAFHINAEVENIGARRLHTVMSKLLNDILFDIPEQIPPNAKVLITKEMVQERLNGLVQNKDLSEFIL